MKQILLLFIILPAISLSAQKANDLFVHIPDSLMPLFSSVDRSVFADFLESNMKARVKNKFDTVSEMTDLTSDYIRLQVTPHSTWQMKLLAVSDTTQIICTVSTACAPACDSHIRFYTVNWGELSAQDYLPLLPKPDDFLQIPDSIRIDKYGRVRVQTELALIKADLSKTDNTLSFAFTAPHYPEEGEANPPEEYFRGVVVYEWKNEKFQPVR
ncbi:hypothetical protein EZS27_001222 [termite gut metagenome]|uniref:DUF3256 family protein n=1 Tax=termite gut metagenome TaxID=433724 RepID=A0A5J4T198_9ZZZZ